MFTYYFSVNIFLLDQSSLPFIVLIFLLSGVCLYCAGTESNTINYVTLVLIILLLLFILFLSWNIFIFFIYYEFLVIILFISLFLFITSFFKVRSAFYFFIFSLFGSIFFFYVIAVFPVITKVIMINSALVFSLPFLVKLPSFPFSYWLPEVHTEANTSISVILAGLILKLGIFGIMRYCYITFDLFFAIINCGLLTLTLIIILVIMCSFFRFAVDLKKIIAFSSITHLNLTFSALITLNNSGILTAIITSFAHGLSSVALFLFVGSVIARTYSRNIDSLFFLDFKLRLILLFLLLCNLGFPLTCNFLGELLSVISLISVSSFFAFIFLLSSLVFTLFWFFIYNRKLPYYSIRLALFSTEKLIAIWLCILLVFSGTFLVTLFSINNNNCNSKWSFYPFHIDTLRSIVVVNFRKIYSPQWLIDYENTSFLFDIGDSIDCLDSSEYNIGIFNKSDLFMFLRDEKVSKDVLADLLTSLEYDVHLCRFTNTVYFEVYSSDFDKEIRNFEEVIDKKKLNIYTYPI